MLRKRALELNFVRKVGEAAADLVQVWDFIFVCFYRGMCIVLPDRGASNVPTLPRSLGKRQAV